MPNPTLKYIRLICKEMHACPTTLHALHFCFWEVKMVDAISGFSATGAVSAVSSASTTASLQAQLAQYQRQLSDCVNCSSANTPEGKEQIQEISSKISAIKQRIEAASESSGTQRSTRINNSGNLAPGSQVAPSSPAVSANGNANSLTLGSTIDVYA
jgi:hypothetical protein